jgi:hypothetical protein
MNSSKEGEMAVTQLLEAIPWKDLEAYTNAAEGTLESALYALLGDRDDVVGRQVGNFFLETGIADLVHGDSDRHFAALYADCPVRRPGRTARGFLEPRW